MKIKLLFLLLLLHFSVIALAQPGSIDTSFNPTDIGFGSGDLANSTVNAIVAQSDDKIIFGGAFTYYNGITINRIARLNSDGTLDTGFIPGTGANSTIQTIALQADGKIIIGGSFTNYNGISRNGIARLNTDGSLDTGFFPGTGFNTEVKTIAVQLDGKIIVGGNFTSYSGTTVNRIVRLNSDGGLDTSFVSGTRANDIVQAIVFQSDGKIVIGGNFTIYNGTSINRIARLNSDGTLDTSFTPGSGANNTIQKIAIQSDGKIFIGGSFTNFNGTTVNRIARLNSDGILDTSFTPGSGANSNIQTITLQSDGKIIVGGNFTTYNSIAINRIFRLNSNGTLDTSFTPGTGASATIQTIALLSDGKIFIGGDFVRYNDIIRRNITRLNSDGTLDTSFTPTTGSNNLVQTIAIQPDGKILIGGGFSNYNGTTRNLIARLNSDGTLDTSFDPGSGANISVHTIAIQSDGKIIIGGSFTNFNGTISNRIVRLNSDGSLDTSFNSGTGTNNTVKTIAIQSDGKIIIGGFFTTYNGNTRNYIARLNSDGTLDPSFIGTGADNTVYTIAIQSDGKIVIGGDFINYNGTTRNRIARLNVDGSLDTSFNPGSGTNNAVQTIAIQSDGKILIGGGFVNYNGTSRQSVARLNSDGTLDTSFNTGTTIASSVLTIAIQSDGKILIGGSFAISTFSGRNYIACLNSNGSFDTSFTGAGANDSVRSISIQTDGKIIIGGDFTGYDNIGRNRIARIHGVTPLQTNSAQTFCNAATVSDLKATGTAIKWYSVSTGGTALATSTALTTGTYYATQTLNGVESPRTAVSVTVNITPAPTAIAQTFAAGAKVSNLQADGSNIKWYTASTGGTALASSTALSTGKYYVSQTINGCESSRTAVDVTVTSQVPTCVPSNGLIAYYPFTGNANDTSGNGYNGTATGTILTTDRNGNANAAYSFDGVSSYIDATIATIPQNNAPRTISGWFKTNSPNFTENYYSTIFNYGSLSTTQRFALGMYSKGYLDFITGSSYTGNGPESQNDYFDNAWHFVTITYDGTKVSLFIDGNYADGGNTTLNTINKTFRIGKRITGDTYNEYFKGSIDDIGIWNRVLTANEISNLYNLDRVTATISPASATVCFGNTVQLTSTVTPSGTYTYTWAQNGNPIPGATSATFGATSSGNYSLTVKDSNGIVVATSNTAIVTINTTPSPTASAQTFNNNATVGNLQASGQNIKWYSDPNTGGGETPLATSTQLQTGKYYVSQTINGCESSRTAVDVTVTISTAYTLIPDLNFENKLIALGIDSGTPDGKVLTSSVSSVTSLNVTSSSIANLTGIQDFTALTVLLCGGNQLTDLDISQNTALMNLTCFNNKLTSLDVSKNTALTMLHCYNNQLTSLDVSKNTALTRVDCSSNQLTALDVSTNLKLTNINCSYNKLTALDVSTNLKLTNINCSSNQIKTLDVSKNIDLANLSCLNNQLTALDVSTNLKLTNINCSSNQIKTLDVSKNITLVNLSCSHNQLALLNISDNVALEYLYCGSNELTAMDFSKNPILKGLWCEDNQISNLDVSNNIQLYMLDFHNNNLSSLNLKNGHNTIIDLSNLNFKGNPKLTCIQVDNVVYSNANWSDKKDATASYSTDCRTVIISPAVSALCSGSSVKLTSVISPVGNYTYEWMKDDVLLPNEITASFTATLPGSYKLIVKDLNGSIVGTSNVATVTSNSTPPSTATTQNFNTGATVANLQATGLTIKWYTDATAETPLSLSTALQTGTYYVSQTISECESQRVAVDVIVVSIPEGYTAIPDSNFEKKLIALGYDSGTPDGKVLTSNVSTRTSLDVSGSQISDLTGIEDFAALTRLYCDNNQITSLDVSKNTALTILYCDSNQLASLNVNVALEDLLCYNNLLTKLDVSASLSLRRLYCYSNLLTSLDVNAALKDLLCYSNQLTNLNFSKNVALTRLNCESNQLQSLNLRNGKNSLLNSLYLKNNPNLTCIQVDDVAYANTNWSGQKDATASYSENCDTSFAVIPDPNFEQKLIDLGIDTDGLNGKITVANINSITSLDLSNSNIKDLTGIEYFTSLNILDCRNNQLVSLDLSKNTNLQILYVAGNPLVFLNLRNGNNQNLIIESITSKKASATPGTSFLGLTTLGCIKVDNADYSNTYWSKIKEETTVYSETCTLGMEDSEVNKAVLYPNPTSGEVNILNITVEKATVYNALGQLVKTTKFTDTSLNNTINLAGLPSGMYCVYIESEGVTIVKKIILE